METRSGAAGAALDDAVAALKDGRLADAVATCERVLGAEPERADALHLLGVIAEMKGDLAGAEKRIGLAIERDAEKADYHNNLGNVSRKLGKTARAIECYATAHRLRPADPSIAVNFAATLRGAGYTDRAIDILESALEANPAHERLALELAKARLDEGETRAALTLLEDPGFRLAFRQSPTVAILRGFAHLRLRDIEVADDAFRDAIRRDPANSDGLFGRGLVAMSRGQLQDARSFFFQATRHRPDHVDAFARLGDVSFQLGDLVGAREAYETVLGREPRRLRIVAALCDVLRYMGDAAAARELCEAARKANEPNVEIELRLSELYRLGWRITEAAQAARTAIDLAPRDARAHAALGNCLLAAGHQRDALTALTAALDCPNATPGIHSADLVALQYQPGITQDRLLTAHRGWEQRWDPGVPFETHDVVPDPKRKMRIGLVSGDFRAHPIGLFARSYMRHRDPDETEVHIYTDCQSPDGISAEIRTLAAQWVFTRGLSDAAVAKRIREDGIDVLVDMTGHFGDVRLGVFCRQPAPVQAKWDSSTTGLTAIEYLIADPVTVPLGSEAGYRERIVRVPHSYVCFDRPDVMPEVGPLPAAGSGFVTFGCFNNLAKVTRPTMDAWAVILRDIPDARLVLKTFALSDKGVRTELAAEFAGRGISADRLAMIGGTDRESHLAAYAKVDISLDPFPYSGNMITFDSLVMGVPVLTLPGETFASRHAASLLCAAGLGDWVASSIEDYVANAVEKAADLEDLAKLRASLRDKVLVSPACDGPAHAAAITDAFRRMWRTWCKRHRWTPSRDKGGATQHD